MKINRKCWIWRPLNIFGDFGKNSLSTIEKAILSSFPLAEGRLHDPSMKSLVNFYLLEYREIYTNFLLLLSRLKMVTFSGIELTSFWYLLFH